MERYDHGDAAVDGGIDEFLIVPGTESIGSSTDLGKFCERRPIVRDVNDDVYRFHVTSYYIWKAAGRVEKHMFRCHVQPVVSRIVGVDGILDVDVGRIVRGNPPLVL
ncbi:MAG: hypothetical protein L3K03_09125 [Thermoplasmata archaeon]|nr:hypothetical protein [Thermoplasmata archaeon]